jgi:hypothetical protein
MGTFSDSSWVQSLSKMPLFWRYDIQHNDTQHNSTQHSRFICDTQHNDTQRKGLICDTQHNGLISDTQHNSIRYCYAECRLCSGVTNKPFMVSDLMLSVIYAGCR